MLLPKNDLIISSPSHSGKSIKAFACFLCFTLILSLAACQPSPQDRTVVIYTSVDQHYSEPILTAFQEKTGIRVRPVFDIEAAKTTGLVNRIIAEKDRPMADVFWSGEHVQTILLKKNSLLAPYDSPSAEGIPARYRDRDGFWTGFAGRARVLIINTDLLSPEDAPRSIFDLLKPQWPGDKVGMAYPIFGTAATHAAALYARLGPEKGKALYRDLRERGLRIVDGNSVVRDLVAGGQLMMGLTDTDDACGAKSKGAPVSLVFLDQEEGGMGTLIIPNTVGLIARAPHPEEAKELIDYLLSVEVEKDLIRSGWCHIPLRRSDTRSACFPDPNVRGMDVDLTRVYEQLMRTKTELTDIFVR